MKLAMKPAMRPATQLLQVAAGALAFALSLGNAAAQQGLREKLIGTWTFVVAEITAANGQKSFPFGETPKGLLVFTPDGHFAQIPHRERRSEDRVQQPPQRHGGGICRDHAPQSVDVRHL